MLEAHVPSLNDRAVRIGYRVAYRLARIWWGVRRPKHQGALVAVWAAGRLLLVRQSYQHLPAFPGGGVQGGEAPAEAARRELREELGLQALRQDLVTVCVATELWNGRRDTVTFFEWHMAEEPVLRPDGREVIAAAFVAAADVPRRVAGPVAYYLAFRRRAASAASPTHSPAARHSRP